MDERIRGINVYLLTSIECDGWVDLLRSRVKEEEEADHCPCESIKRIVVLFYEPNSIAIALICSNGGGVWICAPVFRSRR